MKKAILIALIFLFIEKCNGAQLNDIYKTCDIEHMNNIEIIYYPVYINTYTAMSDKELQSRYIYKLEIVNIRENPEHGEILKMLNFKYINNNKKSDIRWGFAYHRKTINFVIYILMVLENMGKLITKMYHSKKII